MATSADVTHQAKLCLNALGFAAPTDAPQRVVHTSPGFNDPMWIVSWRAFDLRISDRGTLTYFKLLQAPYVLLNPPKTQPRFNTSDEAKTELTRLSFAAGVDPAAFSESVSWKRIDGKIRDTFAAESIDEYSLFMVAKNGDGKFGRSMILVSAKDGAVRTYFLDAKYGRDKARVIGTFDPDNPQRSGAAYL